MQSSFPRRNYGKRLNKLLKQKVWMPTRRSKGWRRSWPSRIRKRQHRLQLARTHICACLIPDEKNVNRLGAYERGLDAASRRYLNDLYRAQAFLRLGQPAAAPIAVDVNVTEEHGNGLH